MTDVIVIRWGGHCSRQARGPNHPNLSKHKKWAMDIRTYWRNGDDDTWKPSKKGVTVKPELVGELIALLRKAEGRGT